MVKKKQQTRSRAAPQSKYETKRSAQTYVRPRLSVQDYQAFLSMKEDLKLLKIKYKRASLGSWLAVNIWALFNAGVHIRFDGDSDMEWNETQSWTPGYV
jgi:hypothetical protein